MSCICHGVGMLFQRRARAVEEDRPVLPPRAKYLDNFSATCIRCYACDEFCGYNAIEMRMGRDGNAVKIERVAA